LADVAGRRPLRDAFDQLRQLVPRLAPLQQPDGVRDDLAAQLGGHGRRRILGGDCRRPRLSWRCCASRSCGARRWFRSISAFGSGSWSRRWRRRPSRSRRRRRGSTHRRWRDCLDARQFARRVVARRSRRFGGGGSRRLHHLDSRARGRGWLGPRWICERHEALDVLDADQVRQERHQLQRLREFAVAHRLARLAVRLELEELLARDLQNPARRPVMLRPGLHTRVSGIAQLDVFEMELDARKPFLDQLGDASIGRGHAMLAPVRYAHYAVIMLTSGAKFAPCTAPIAGGADMNAKISGGLIQATMFGGALLACSALHAATSNWSPPRSADGKPVISGVWSNASVTNLTRPAGVTKLVVTREEAEALVKANPFQRLIEADNGPSDLNDNLLEDKNADRGYNAFWVDPGNFLASVNGEYRTSWIVEPANGQMPLSDAGRKLIQAGRAERDLNLYAGPEALPLPERCLIAFSGASGPGMLNPMYNNNYQIVQTPDAVLINVEMVHDARIVPISKDKATAQASHKPAALNKWFGDPVGWWEGDTLV